VRGFYPIVDLDALSGRGFDPVQFAARVLEARPPLLQLRAKNAPARAVLALLRELRPLCHREGTLLFANDRPDLAVLAGADGVHLGQNDLPPAEARRFAPDLLLGLSTHDLDELEAALAERPAYVAFGPVFPTRSKARPEPVVGLELLARAGERARERGIPLVAIGGIDHERASLVAQHAAIGCAIAALLAPTLDEVAARAHAFAAPFGAAR